MTGTCAAAPVRAGPRPGGPPPGGRGRRRPRRRRRPGWGPPHARAPLAPPRSRARPRLPLVGRSAHFPRREAVVALKVLDSPTDLPHTDIGPGCGRGPPRRLDEIPAHPIGSTRRAAAVTRFMPIAVIGTVVLAAASMAGMPSASAAVCNNYGVGIAIIPQFVGTSDIAITAYPGEVIDYDVTVFLKADPPGTPQGVVVCPIYNGTLTLVLPDGSGPFTLDTNISLPVGGSKTYQNVPAGQKYTMNPADIVPNTVPERVQATAQVVALSAGLDGVPNGPPPQNDDGDV